MNEVQGGGKEVTIQGDVCFDLPAVLISEFKVSDRDSVPKNGRQQLS